MKLQNLLIGNTPKDQAELDMFFSDIEEEKILWYPSSGTDYRDILEVTAPRLLLHGIKEPPNIICHTDYFAKWIDLDKEILHKDERTTVQVVGRCNVLLRPEAKVIYQINPKHVDFPDEAPIHPTIYFLKLKINSNILGEITSNVFFFLFENYNFLEQIILKNRIRITHFVKVREGCGFGGNRKSISVFYSLLGNIGVKYLFIDDEIHYCRMTHDRIAYEFSIQHKKFDLLSIGSELFWSGFKVKVFEVIPRHGDQNKEEFIAILEQISGKNDVDII